MSYGKEIHISAEKLINSRKINAEAEAQEKYSSFIALHPRVEEIRFELARTSALIAKTILSSANVKSDLVKLKEKNKALIKERSELYKLEGLTEKYFEPAYTCKKCSDTGYKNGKMCSCFKDAMRSIAYSNLNMICPLKESAFSKFSLNYYDDTCEDKKTPSERARMEKIYEYCKKYAAEFSENSHSIIMQGGTGLGKTHLSLAIAGEVIKKGFGVIYSSTQNIFDKIESEHFGQSTGNTLNLVLECDLLILDDLGTEFFSGYTAAGIYNIINTRLMQKKPTIISTNLSVKEIDAKYGERFISRIMSEYSFLFFTGTDIRQQKRFKNKKS